MELTSAQFFFTEGLSAAEVEIKMAGSGTRLVNVAVTRVREVSQPSAFVPPKPLKRKLQAGNKHEACIHNGMPVLCMVSITVVFRS